MTGSTAQILMLHCQNLLHCRALGGKPDQILALHTWVPGVGAGTMVLKDHNPFKLLRFQIGNEKGLTFTFVSLDGLSVGLGAEVHPMQEK
jgi:hypothetical protein